MNLRKKLFPILKREKETLVPPHIFINVPIIDSDLKGDKQNAEKKDNSPIQLKKTKKIIEAPTNDKIYQIISANLIPITSEYYIKDNNESLDIIKDISKSNSIFKSKIIKNIKTNLHLQIILPPTDDIENIFTFWVLKKVYFDIITIKHINAECTTYINHICLSPPKYELKGCLYLDTDNILIFKQTRPKYACSLNGKEQKLLADSKITAYDNNFDKFSEEKIILNINQMIYDYFKITNNIFAFSVINKIIIKRINNSEVPENEIVINEPYIGFLYYNEKENILFCEGKSTIYLINLSSVNPEVFQKLDSLNMFSIRYRYYFFEEDSIYLQNIEKNSNYEVLYLNQYKMKDGELINVSKIEMTKINNIYD